MKETNKPCYLQHNSHPPVLAAPMAGITDKIYRGILAEMGVDYCFTDMICAKAMCFNNAKTAVLMDISGEQEFCGIQLFGASPKEIATVAAKAEENGAKVIDLNMGCPVPKVVNNGEGAALLKDLPLAERIIAAAVKAVSVPVTVKLRRGFDGGREGLELAKRAESAGAGAVTVHGRDRVQYYAGEADWNFIAEVKAAISIPVIGNGDIFTPADAERMLAATGCDGIMVARGMLGNPWLISNIVRRFQGKREMQPTAEDRGAMALRQLRESVALYGEWQGVRFMRKFFGWYIRGYRDAAEARRALNGMTETAVIEEYLHGWMEKNCEEEHGADLENQW